GNPDRMGVVGRNAEGLVHCGRRISVGGRGFSEHFWADGGARRGCCRPHSSSRWRECGDFGMTPVKTRANVGERVNAESSAGVVIMIVIAVVLWGLRLLEFGWH